MNLPHDELTVLYRVEAMGSDPARLRASVNRISSKIHARLKQEKDLRQTTLSRRMEIIWRYDNASRRQVRDGWKLVQRERVTTRRLADAAAWIDAIEKAGGHLDSLQYGFSEATLHRTRASLRLQAVADFRKKATELARALDATSFRILSLKTTSDRPLPYPIAERAMMKADAAPSLQAGEGPISVTVSGSILLPPKDYPVR